MKIRPIRDEEIALAKHLLTLAGKDVSTFKFPTEVDDYEGGVMGSINFTLTDSSDYAGDLVQVEYYDIDEKRMLITLTQNKSGELLDMDFWKEDHSKLVRYPTAELVAVNTKGM